MWLRLVAIAIGLWVQASAYVFECDGPAAANLYIVGPVAVSIACIAIWEVMRPMRWVNLLLGVWLAISPLFLNYPTAAAANAAVSGIVIAALRAFVVLCGTDSAAAGPRFGMGTPASTSYTLATKRAHPVATKKPMQFVHKYESHGLE